MCQTLFARADYCRWELDVCDIQIDVLARVLVGLLAVYTNIL